MMNDPGFIATGSTLAVPRARRTKLALNLERFALLIESWNTFLLPATTRDLDRSLDVSSVRTFPAVNGARLPPQQ
jgi:hypothetical protein